MGFADLYVPKWDLEIRGCTLHQKSDYSQSNQQSIWINFPSREYVDDEKKKKWSPFLFFRNPKNMEAFRKEAKEAIDKFRKENLGE